MTRRTSRPIHIADSAVMGRLPVLVTAGFLAAAGAAQLVGAQSSMVISQAGGRPLDVVWSLALLMAFAVLLLARALARRPRDAVLVEVVGIVLFVAGSVTYIWAATDDGLAGKLVLIGYAGGAAVNAAGRAVLLLRRRWWLDRSRA